ncbi:NAD(P)-binding domain-containing protein [Microvirga sp. TS319]|uniref:NAD(P)-binding domain-containing protein n=1 Tax=Microvirga sp. TS319 TaxID=3241165 RepID=UPI00351A8EBA
MSASTAVTIVGAGPYGLSLAAHLGGLGVDYRIIGRPMESWMSKMPKGMLLKSAGFASNLHDPERAFTLREFYKDHGYDYADVDRPIPLETFSSYGVAFQQRFVPNVENEELVALDKVPGGFDLHMRSGTSFRTSKVVIAVGFSHFQYLPELLTPLRGQSVSHAAEHHDLQRFQGQRVAVLGGGASAIDLAVLLHEAHANVQLITRKPAIAFSGPWGGRSRPLLEQIRYPLSGIGPGWKQRLLADLPWLYRYLPEQQRIRIAQTFLGPAGGWDMKSRAAPVPLLARRSLQEASAAKHGVQLRLDTEDGSAETVEVDHVICATGYKADVHRLPFLKPDILEHLRLTGKTPQLSVNYESSVPGLYFMGFVSATTFGPVMRFVFGAGFASRRISRHLERRV